MVQNESLSCDTKNDAVSTIVITVAPEMAVMFDFACSASVSTSITADQRLRLTESYLYAQARHVFATGGVR